MKTDREFGIQASNFAVQVTHGIDYDFNWLRRRALNRSIWALRTQRVQDAVVTIMGIVLGGLAGWAAMR